MFNSFKNIVNSSLQELDRLGESSFGLPQEGQQQQQQQQHQQHHHHQQLFGRGGQYGHAGSSAASGMLSHGGRGYSESTVSHLQAAGSSSISAGARRSPNMHARNATVGDERHMPRAGSPMSLSASLSGPFASAARSVSPAGSAAGVMASQTAGPSSRPVTATGAISIPTSTSSDVQTNPDSSAAHQRRGSTDGFPEFSLSNLRRSLSGMSKGSLDLGNLRSALDFDPPTSSSPSSPARELKRSESMSGARRPNLSISTPRRRKLSARSMSLSGPYTPDTMMKQDPFFFTALQALPDELKVAAFTPLPTEDDDEFLEGIDSEMNPGRPSTFPSTKLPQLNTSRMGKSLPPSFTGPSSAPAGGFMRPAHLGSPPSVRSPLIESGKSILGRLEDHVEEEERALSESPYFPPTSAALDEADNALAPQPQVTIAKPTPSIETSAAVAISVPDEKKDQAPSSRPSSALGLDIQDHQRTTGFVMPGLSRSPAPPEKSLPTTTTLQPSSTAQASKPTSRPVSPAPPPKSESLQARLARLAKSRAAGESTPSSSQSAHTATFAPTAASSSTIVKDPLDAAGASANQAASDGTSSTRASMEASRPSLDEKRDVPSVALDQNRALERLLKQYISITGLDDLAGIEKHLRQQQALQAAHESQASGSAKDLESSKVTIATLEAELKDARAGTSRAESKAKEEEEKKAKSISLLKAVRQKLLKAEKDKEDAELLRDANKAAEDSLQNEVRQRTQRFESELMSLRSNQEREVARLKASFDREALSIRAAAEREAAARKGQFELDMLNLRSAQSREVQARDNRINTLETNLRDLRREKDGLFEQLQSKQADVETASSSQAKVQVAFDELQYELREARDRVSALQEEVHSFKKARLDQTRDEGHTRRLLAELESSNSDRLRESEERIKVLEKERSEMEDSMAKKLQEKLRDVENMRREIERRDAENSEETQRREERQQRIERAEKQNLALLEKISALEMLLNESRLETAHMQEEAATTKELLADQARRIADMEGRNEDLTTKEGQLRVANKNLREELRKVQAGILLSEKSRNPGVGYFSSFAQSNAGSPSSSNVNLPGTTGGGATSPPLPSAPTSISAALNGANGSNRRDSTTSLTSQSSVARAGGQSEDEALNFEYIRNVILQFLEHKEMRPHLVSVLAIILHFTPAETRRLTAKASA